jgi:hypothetical protein
MIIAGLVIGGLTRAFPVVMLIAKSKPCFRQDGARSGAAGLG